MEHYSSAQWNKINDFLLTCGEVRNPKDFCVKIIKAIYPLIPYDQARIYFINDSGKIYDEALFGADKLWSQDYLEYYNSIYSARYSIAAMYATAPQHGFKGDFFDWTNLNPKNDKFVDEYIRPQGLQYSLGFGLSDAKGFPKCVFGLDRTCSRNYSWEETQIFNIIRPHLDNLYRNMFVISMENTRILDSPLSPKLTKRESEISTLLCRGLTTNGIAANLDLSITTIYRHIANMHKKLNVSSRQELVIKLLDCHEC